MTGGNLNFANGIVGKKLISDVVFEVHEIKFKCTWF